MPMCCDSGLDVGGALDFDKKPGFRLPILESEHTETTGHTGPCAEQRQGQLNH